MKILLLTGMTPSPGVFVRLLPLLDNAHIVPWISPEPGEPLPAYADRLAATLEPARPCVVCGVSFGGTVARELAPRLCARQCILISSIRAPAQLPPWIRLLRSFAGLPIERCLDAVGRSADCMPRPICTEATLRLRKLAGTEGSWHRWASSAVLRWRPGPELDAVPALQVHGARDQTLPARYVDADILIPDGGHVLPLTHANELAEIIRRACASS